MYAGLPTALGASLPGESALIETDALVIGAGPVGLFQVFQLGLQGVKAQVIDALDYPGGQCVELYPDKPIYDIPGVPVCTGRELTQRLLQQVAPFDAQFHFGQEVIALARHADGRFLVEASKGARFLTKTVFIAAGVGAFQPRKIQVPGLDGFEDRQLFYRLKSPNDFAGQNVVVMGGEDAAIECALALAQAKALGPKSVTLVHRRDGFKATPENVARLRALCAAGAMQFKVGQITGHQELNGQLTQLDVTDPDGQTQQLSTDALLVFLGLSPRLGPIAQWGLDIERRQLKVDTAQFATSEPGIFAVGDINTYPGKKKLILCGFHESTLAAFAAMAIITPDTKVLLQYTTTSTRLHKLLGVETPQPD
jgi:thioredoxin reductase (NADPH)